MVYRVWKSEKSGHFGWSAIAKSGLKWELRRRHLRRDVFSERWEGSGFCVGIVGVLLNWEKLVIGEGLSVGMGVVGMIEKWEYLACWRRQGKKYKNYIVKYVNIPPIYYSHKYTKTMVNTGQIYLKYYNFIKWIL